MDKCLAHLTKDKIEELIKRYFNNEKVTLLIQEYNIEVQPSQLVKLFPPIITNKICSYCGINLVIKRNSRYYNKSEVIPICPTCGHKNSGFCFCKNCEEKEQNRKQNERHDKQKLLDTILKINEEAKVELDSLSFEERVFLGAFLREGISEDFNYVKPIENFVNPLAPTIDFTNEILALLREKRLIVVHPDSDAKYFEIIDPESGRFRYYYVKVKWALNVKKVGVNKVHLVDSLINPENLMDSDLSYHLWRRIALHEGLEYFNYSLNTILGVEYSPGEKTISVINDLINDYSVSQIYTMIYRSTNSALRFQAEREVSRKHAANTIIGGVQSFAEKAKINKWEVQRYNRLKELPESALSKFFFERILKIGFVGFNEKPRLIMQNVKNQG